jgi:hypothetical protein
VSTAQPPGPRYVVRVTAADVGARVVLRRRLPGGGLGDVLGELVRWDDLAVVVRDRNGVEQETARTDVVAAKTVPPPPVRRSR